MKLYFTDLMCFQKNPANIPCKQAFNLDRLPTLSLKNDFAAYIFDRGCTLFFSSHGMRTVSYTFGFFKRGIPVSYISYGCATGYTAGKFKTLAFKKRAGS